MTFVHHSNTQDEKLYNNLFFQMNKVVIFFREPRLSSSIYTITNKLQEFSKTPNNDL